MLLRLPMLLCACATNEGLPEGAAPTSPKAASPGPSAGGTNGRGADAKPFAGSTAEATDLISTAIDKRHTEIGRCVREFRARKKMAHDRVVVSLGIDQEGRVLGVTSKGKEDAELTTCVMDSVKGAPFPRSHAGVITVTKSYEEFVLP